jgi:hypothetical protein
MPPLARARSRTSRISILLAGPYFGILTTRGVVTALAKAGANPNIGKLNEKTLLMHYSEEGNE